MPAVGRCALLASWPRPPLARSAAASPAGWEGAAGHGAADGPRGTRPPANYLLSSVVSFSTRRSMSSSIVPVLGRPRLPASSAFHNYITQLALYVEHPAVVHGRMPAKRDR